MSPSVGARRVTESMVKSSCEMKVVAKATGVGDLAERLVRVQQRSTMQEARRVIQTKRVYNSLQIAPFAVKSFWT
jgi:hypothetical protein